MPRRRAPVIKTGTPMYYMMEYSFVVLGSLIIALSFNLFLNPNRIVSGGVSGISTFVYHFFGIEPAITQWALNIPIFIIGLVLLGGKFAMKAAVGSFLLPLFVLLTHNAPPMTDNFLLASIYGGIGIGVGVGLVFRGRGSTGGSDLVAQIVHKYSGLSLGLSIALLDGVVILIAGFIFTPEKALYSLIGLFVTAKTIDVIQLGFGYSKVAYIISNESDAISHVILNELDRGITKLSAQGGYTGDERKVLMVVVGQTEIVRLKALIREVDPNAFVIISNTTEVLGEGFKMS